MVESEEKKRILELQAEVKELKEKLAELEEKRKSKSKLIEFARTLKPEDRIEVWWVDASESDVRSLALPLSGHNVETRQHEIGWFVGLQKGDTWRDIHLIFQTRRTDVEGPSPRFKITSIPFARVCPQCGLEVLMLVKRLRLLENGKEARKQAENETMPSPPTPMKQKPVKRGKSENSRCRS